MGVCITKSTFVAGRLNIDYLTSSSSCCLSNTRYPSNKEFKSKEKANKVQEYGKFSESHMPSIPHHSSIETYSNTSNHHFRRNSQSYVQEMPSCKYAANAYHTSSHYDSHLSFIRGKFKVENFIVYFHLICYFSFTIKHFFA